MVLSARERNNARRRIIRQAKQPGDWFDHTTTTEAEVLEKSGKENIQPIRCADLSKLTNVVMHPTMKNVTYFFTEYAKALHLDMFKHPEKYHNVSFQAVYERMVTAIVNDRADVKNSTPLKFACKIVNIPCRRQWIQAYIWFDQPVPTQIISSTDASEKAVAKMLEDPEAAWQKLAKIRSHIGKKEPKPKIERTVLRKPPVWAKAAPGDAKE